MESAGDNDGLLASLVHPVGCEFVWGLKNVVQAVSAAQLWNYRWLVESVTPKPKDILPSHPGYSVSYCTNICIILGHSIFHMEAEHKALQIELF